MTISTKIRKRWEDALAYERERVGNDDSVLLYRDEQPCGHLYFGENQAEETECEVGRSPTEWIPVLQVSLEAKMVELGLPLDGWA